MNSQVALSFAPNLVPLIQAGEKTLTYRLGQKYDSIQIGDLVQVKNSDTKEVFATVKILDKSWTTFLQFPIQQLGHEVYSTKDEQRKVFKDYYGRIITDEEPMLVFKFMVVED